MWLISWLRKSPRQLAHKPRVASRFRPSVETLEDRSLPSGGVLDPTFGVGGIITTSVGSAATWANSVASYAQAGTANDGKIVVAGGQYVNGSQVGDVFRYNLDGALDQTFAGAGVVTNKVQSMQDVAVQGDGKVVAVGSTSGSALDFGVVRYNLDGSLDASFGGKGARGQVTTDIKSKSADKGECIAVQPDGKIIVAGFTTPFNANVAAVTDLALVRYNADGSLDNSFGVGGKVVQHFSSVLYRSSGHLDMALDPSDGKIVVASHFYNNPSGTFNTVVARFNGNGSLDGSLGGAGYVTFGTVNNGVSVAVQSDHRILVVRTNSDLTRLNANGTPDSGFATGGTASQPAGVIFKSIAIQRDGDILVAGWGGDYNLAVMRYHAANGSLDTSFGAGGIAQSAGVRAVNSPGQVVLDPDGRIVVVGSTTDRVALARFLATGPQIGSFTANPNPATVGDNITLNVWNITDLNPNSTINQVAFYLDSNGDGILQPTTDALLGYGAQTSPGTWTCTFATSGLHSGSYTLFGQAKDSYGAFGDPFAIVETFV